MKDSIKIMALSAPWHGGIQLLITQGKAVATNFTLEEMPEDQVIDPSLTINLDAAQALMDDLWHSGIRPTEGKQATGTLRAIENHLEDMRIIAFDKLKIKTK